MRVDGTGRIRRRAAARSGAWGDLAGPADPGAVEHELRNPSSARRSLEQADEARTKGEITAEDEAEIQRRAVGRVVKPNLAESREE
jgi:hypothetical protein